MAKILCIDDREVNLSIRKHWLECQGYEVVGVTNVQSALHEAARDHFDLVLIDYHLSGSMTGSELAQDLRVICPNVPLVILTGDPTVPESARVGVDRWLIKGQNTTSELLETIRQLIARKHLAKIPPSEANPGPVRRTG